LSTIGLAAGCGEDDEGGGTAVFVLPRPADEAPGFFDLPWPTDLRKSPDGTLDVVDFPNPQRNQFIDLYKEVVSTRVRGYSGATSTYFRFSTPVDPASLPFDAVESGSAGATVFVIDVETLARHPVVVRYRDEGTIYWSDHTIAVRPPFGLLLEPDRTYAAVVTRGVRPLAGGAYDRDADLDAIVSGGGDATVDAARRIYEPALDAIEASGVPRDDVLSLAVFTTQDPTEELFAIRDWMMSSYPEPVAIEDRWRWVDDDELMIHVEGAYGPCPTFQAGPSPYEAAPSGEIVVEGGVPVVAEEFDARFALTVPKGPMPPAGFPIVLYAHGTGGDYESAIDGGVAEEMASIGWATLGIDQVLHGDRNTSGDAPEFLFFNFLNPLAGRDNTRQAALDVVQQARFARSVEVPLRTIATGGAPVRFDPRRVIVYGHSQGGLNMPLFMAADDQTRGGVLSGAGGALFVAIPEKKQPIDIGIAVQLALRLPGGTTAAAIEMEGFTYEHPILTLLQTWVDPGDGMNYARYLFDRPRPGYLAKSILQIQGMTDDYNPPNTGHALAVAARTPLLMPELSPIEAYDLLGLRALGPPVRGNVADGTATAGLLQWSGGHFVVFRDPNAQAQIRGFVESVGEGTPTIPGP
jgi:hypothetical protein